MTLAIHRAVTSFNSVAANIDDSGRTAQAMWLVRGMDELWTTRGEDTIIPGTHGRVARTRKRDYLVIELVGFIAGVGASPALELASVRTRISALRSTYSNTQLPATLIVDAEDSTAGSIVCRPLNIVFLDFPDPVFRPFSIELEAIGNDWSFS